jgi:hypothetical protein
MRHLGPVISQQIKLCKLYSQEIGRVIQTGCTLLVRQTGKPSRRPGELPSRRPNPEEEAINLLVANGFEKHSRSERSDLVAGDIEETGRSQAAFPK